MSTRALLIVVALVLLVATPSTAQIENWVTVSPPLETYIIKMPGAPEKKLLSDATAYFYGESPKTDRLLVTAVSRENLDSPMLNVEAFLKKMAERYAKTLEAKVVSTTRRDYQKDSPMGQPFPGLEAKMTNDCCTVLWADYVINRKFYEMEYFAANKRYSQAEAERFLNSFVVLRY